MLLILYRCMKEMSRIGPLRDTSTVEQLDSSEYRSTVYFHTDSETFYKFLGRTKSEEIVWEDTLRELSVSDASYNSVLDGIEGICVTEDGIVVDDSDSNRRMHGFEIDPRKEEICFVLGVSAEQEFGRPVIALFYKII